DQPGGGVEHQLVDVARVGRRVARGHVSAHRGAGEVQGVEPERREQHLVVLDVVGQLVQRRVGALAEGRAVRAVDAEPVGQRSDALEAVERAAAVEIDQRLSVADRVSDGLDSVDAVDEALEALGAVCPFWHRSGGSGLCGRDARARGEVGEGEPGEDASAVHAGAPGLTGSTGMAAPLISWASEEARTSEWPWPAWAIIPALSSARRTGSGSDSRRLKLVDIGEVTSRNTRRS